LATNLTEDERKNLLLDLDFKVTDTDEMINTKIDTAINLARKHGYNKKRKEWDTADKLFAGDTESLIRSDHDQSPAYKSDTVLNLVYPFVRNQAGLMTDQRPQPVAIPSSSNDQEEYEAKLERARLVDKTLGAKWEEKGMQEKLPEAAIQQTKYADTFFHPFWNFHEDDVDCVIVPPHNLFIEPNAKSLDEADWLIHRETRTAAWLTKQFDLKDNFFDTKDLGAPEVAAEQITDTDVQVNTGTVNEPMPENAITVDHVWTDDVMIIRGGKKIIKKEQNPLWEWREPEEQLEEFMDEQIQLIESEGVEVTEEIQAQIQDAHQPILNFFDRPMKPYVHLKSVNDGKQLYSSGVMKQLLPVIQTINQRKQQIDDNANDMANAQIWYDGREIDSTTVEAQIVNMPGAVSNFPGMSQNAGSVQRVSGVGLPQYVIEDMFHSQRIFDDISGQHEVSRGAKAVGKQTATQVSRQAEADQVVVRLLVRQLETATVDVFKWWIQMFKLFYTEPKLIQIHGINDARDFFEFSRTDIDDGMDIRVKPGSTLPVNKETRRQEALMLMQQGFMAPVDGYEALDFQNPEKMAENLALWQTGQAPGQVPQEVVGHDPQQENILLLDGQQVPVSELDNHDLHMEAHQDMFMEIANKIPPEIQQIIIDHINEHLVLIEGQGGDQQGGAESPPAQQ